jgi:hypothetical protein
VLPQTGVTGGTAALLGHPLYWRWRLKQPLARLPTGPATRSTSRGARPPQVLEDTGGKRLLSTSRSAVVDDAPSATGKRYRDEGLGGEIEEAAGETPNDVALGQHPWHGARDASLGGSILQFNKVFGNGHLQRWRGVTRRGSRSVGQGGLPTSLAWTCGDPGPVRRFMRPGILMAQLTAHY